MRTMRKKAYKCPTNPGSSAGKKEKRLIYNISRFYFNQ